MEITDIKIRKLNAEGRMKAVVSVTFDNELETQLFNIMRAASKDGLLEAKEFERWCSSNYSEFFSLFKRFYFVLFSSCLCLNYSSPYPKTCRSNGTHITF